MIDLMVFQFGGSVALPTALAYVEISRISMEFNLANQQHLFISWELIFAKLDFPKQQR